MALLPYVDESKASEKTREILGNTPRKMNVARMIANSDAVFQNFSRLGHSLLTRAKLNGKLREIAILEVARLSGSRYEWVQHEAIATALGVGRDEVRAVEHGHVDRLLDQLGPWRRMLALGLTTMVAVQAFVNISVVLGLMPTKGIPLPFVSAGGSSLLINLVGMGILLNVSQHASPEA